MRDVISKLCDISQKSFYVWKNKSHKNLIKLLEQYFTENEIDEFLTTQQIKKYDLVKKYEHHELVKIINQYENSIEDKKGLDRLIKNIVDAKDFTDLKKKVI